MTGATNYRTKDYPRVRGHRICPICELPKRRGNVACEPCLRLHNLREFVSRKRAHAILLVEAMERELEGKP